MQVITALRNAGHRVTVSMPLISATTKKHLWKVTPHWSPEELWYSENYFDPDIVLHRVQPDIAVFCNVNCFRAVRRFAKDIVHILDLYGPLQFEGLLMDNPDYEAAMRDGPMLELRSRDLVEKFRSIDYLVTVSERQKYFWSAYCSLAGYSFRELNVLVCPAAFVVPETKRNTAERMTVVYSGGFYPWQNPDRFLRAAAEILSKMDNAVLHIYGGPHPGLPNEADVNKLLEELQKIPCVKYHGYRPVEELLATLSTAWCALELMEQNLERELAITGRTVEFLASGTPVIYNDYSTLSQFIQRYKAGWTLSTADTSGLKPVFEELAAGGRKLVEELSSNARRLAREEFDAEKSMAPFVALCAKPLQKRTPPAKIHSRKAHVLAISPAAGPLLELRVSNPLRALLRQQLIGGVTVSDVRFEKLRGDQSFFDTVLVQRTVPGYIYRTLANLTIPFLSDFDDNLLARAAYRREEEVEFEAITGLRLCTSLSVPNPRIVRMLEKYSGLPLANKAFITPNALPFPSAVSERRPPSQIIWIQSDIAALTSSREDVVRAVEDFSRKHKLPVILIGKNVLERPQFTNQVVMGHMDFAANLQLLEFAPTSIGVAPLESSADQETLDFVAAKSDLKLLLFAGYGHPGVYSASPPYSDCAYGSQCSLVDNSYNSWITALEYEFNEGWRNIGKLQAQVGDERHIDRVARESWAPAIASCTLSRPIRGSELYEAMSGSQLMNSSPASSIGYMLANTDVQSNYLHTSDRSPRDHYREHGHAEGRFITHDIEAHRKFLSNLSDECAALVRNGPTQNGVALPSAVLAQQRQIEALQREVQSLRNSLSWKITSPLRKLGKPIMERSK